ncbi:MAG: hypothetical protein DME69_10465 [Verrucomicrobia bacterium]|nr:MAG: hypothetical protein DME69_10465 [Verrucomicrobiota bacterium]
MKVHLKQIPTEGLHLEGDEECPIPELETDGIRCVGPLHYNVDLGVAGGALWASGLLSQPVELRCVSCLRGSFAKSAGAPALRSRCWPNLQAETNRNCRARNEARIGLECAG